MVDETQASGGAPEVEDNGPWWAVFLVIWIFLFASATAFLVHSLAVTFG